jgi:hypothetical protein
MKKIGKIKLNVKYKIEDDPDFYFVVREDDSSYYVVDSITISELMFNITGDLDFRPAFEVRKNDSNDTASDLLEAFLTKEGCTV